MIPYELIVTSASRPHLLRPTLESLLRHADQAPARVLVHDDAAFPGRSEGVRAAIFEPLGLGVPLRDLRDNIPALEWHYQVPPVGLGLALKWLLDRVTTEYVLYAQDDFVTVRDLPVGRALRYLDYFKLNSIRFNKRATMAYKDTWRGRWHKEEFAFRLPHGEDCPARPYGNAHTDGCTCCDRVQVLTVADHWGFQTSVWRVAAIRAALDFCLHPSRVYQFRTGVAEDLLNRVLDGEEGEVPGVVTPVGAPDPQSADVRRRYQRTFIYGGVGEDRYIRHVGADPADWAGGHRREAPEPGAAARAWREIAEHERKEGGAT